MHLPVLALLAALLLSPWAALAQHVFLPGADIGLVPLPGMVAARGFTGFIGPGPTAVSITTSGEGPTDLAEVMDTIAQRMAEGGYQQTARHDIPVAGTTAPVWEGTGQVDRSGQAIRVLLISMVLATGDRMVGVSVSTPLAEATAEKRAAIEAMLRSVVVRPADPIGARAALPFRFDETEGLRVNRVMSGNAAFLAPPGSPDTGPDSAHLPRLIIELSPTPLDATAGTLEAHALATLDRLESARNRDRTQDRIRRDLIAGGPGVAVRLTGDDGTRIALWLALAPDHRPLVVVAWAPPAEFDRMLPEFEKVVASIRLR